MLARDKTRPIRIVSNLILLWDAGTEVNEEPGVGENQAPRQAGPNTGDDEMGVVTIDIMDGFEYPAVHNIARVSIYVGDMMMDDMGDDMGGEG